MSTCSRPILLNRVLREAGLLSVRPGPFGEMLDTFGSRAFAVCDHQLAHVYVARRRRPRAGARADRRDCRVCRASSTGDERREIGLDHPRAGDLVVLSEADCLVRLSVLARRPPGPRFRPDRRHPPQARLRPLRAVLRPAICSGPRVARCCGSLQKKLGFRTLFDVIPLDPTLVRGSHGVPAARPEDRPILIGDGPAPPRSGSIPMTEVHDLLLRALVPE